MDIDKYQSLTGITVDASDVAKITAQIRRTRTLLESMLGYSLEKKKAGINQYEEEGKVTTDCIFRGTYNLDNLVLSAPDEVIGTYRLFNYNQADEFFSVDPFTQLNKVKLVFVKPGEAPNGVTHKTFEDGRMGVHREGQITKYIRKCPECLCSCNCEDCVQLAVDANWLNEECLPEELLYIWADMVSYYSSDKSDIKSETLGTHSYTKFDPKIPEQLPENMKIIQKYAGPNGSARLVLAI